MGMRRHCRGEVHGQQQINNEAILVLYAVIVRQSFPRPMYTSSLTRVDLTLGGRFCHRWSMIVDRDGVAVHASVRALLESGFKVLLLDKHSI